MSDIIPYRDGRSRGGCGLCNRGNSSALTGCGGGGRLRGGGGICRISLQTVSALLSWIMGQEMRSLYNLTGRPLPRFLGLRNVSRLPVAVVAVLVVPVSWVSHGGLEQTCTEQHSLSVSLHLNQSPLGRNDLCAVSPVGVLPPPLWLLCWSSRSRGSHRADWSRRSD